MVHLPTIHAATEQCLGRGYRVLNAFLFGADERAHVAELLKAMAPPNGAMVLDAGCGVGEVAKIMGELRPDLTFKLLNLSPEQLALCPEGMERLCADFIATGLADGSVDVVMFNYSLCHADDWLGVLREAARVLKDGGVLFLNDMVRRSGSNGLMHQITSARAFTIQQVADVARRAGFDFTEGTVPEVHAARLRDVFEDKAQYDVAFAGVTPVLLRWTKASFADPIESAFARHSRIAFQFSGGRDSTAALYLLRPWWNRLTVYHLDTGDHFPETDAVVAQVERDVPIQRIKTDVRAVREAHGLPSDVVPVDNMETGQLVSGREVRLQSRYDCCWRALMAPMHRRMIEDGVSLIIRGQRDDEYASPPKRSGEVGEGIEVLYPIQDWSAELVSAFLADNELPVAPFYERGMRRAPECMGCTAWWDEGRAAYLRDHHPGAHVVYVRRMAVIRAEIDRQMAMLEAY